MLPISNPPATHIIELKVGEALSVFSISYGACSCIFFVGSTSMFVEATGLAEMSTLTTFQPDYFSDFTTERPNAPLPPKTSETLPIF